MSIHSVCSNAPSLRFVSQAQRMKWAFTSNKNLFCSRKVLQGVCDVTPKILYAHSSVQSFKYEIQEVEKEQSIYLRENFLKENFNIINSHYFKLITHPSDCSHLEELLWTDEFKKILSRSSFSYDVDVVEGSKNFIAESSNFYPNVSKEIICSFEKSCVNKPSVNGFDVVLISSSEIKENINGKASEEQLLYIINRLTYSLINFFEKPHDFSIYHKNIVFQNNIKGVTIRGLSAYAQSMYLMRFYGFLHFSKVKVEILKVTHHVEDGSIRVRWRVNGLPRHKLLIMLWKHRSVNWHSLPREETQWLDGFSIFSVGDDGLIYKHICDKMIPDDEQVLSKNLDLKSRVLGLLGLAPRRPAALNALIPCCRNQDLVPCKKLT